MGENKLLTSQGLFIIPKRQCVSPPAKSSDIKDIEDTSRNSALGSPEIITLVKHRSRAYLFGPKWTASST